MSIHESSELVREFASDHQVLSRGIAALRAAIREDRVAEAQNLAEHLDQSVGAHIEFEETILYPLVGRALGAAYADRLYQEHRTGRDVIARVLALPAATPIPGVTQAACLSGLEKMEDHVFSCGTLVSYLTAADQDAQRQMLEQLRALRRDRRRWTDLPTAAPTSQGPDLEPAVPAAR